jgi:hypothetical protein
MNQTLVSPPAIPATQEAEIRRTAVQSQPRQIAHKTLSRKNPSQKRAGGVAVGVVPEFKLQYRKKKKFNMNFGGDIQTTAPA